MIQILNASNAGNAGNHELTSPPRCRGDVGTEHDIQILMAVVKLTPLGDPAPVAPKWFAAVEMIRLATDRDWLPKATKEIAKYCRLKRERQALTK